MQRKIFVTVGFLVFFIFEMQSQSLKLLPNTFFKGGESLKFILKYGFITGGNVTLDITETTNNAAGLQHIIGVAKTTGLADKIFKVNDVYESYIDRNTGFPVMAIQNVHEGKKYKYFNEVHYNRQNSEVTSSKSGMHKVPAGILDMISVFYFIRRLDFSELKEGESYKIFTFFSDEQFPLELRYKGIETVSTKWGKISCLKFSPIVEPGRVFKTKDDMQIWFTDDENRIPILIKMDMVVGHMTCELVSFENLKNKPNFKN